MCQGARCVYCSVTKRRPINVEVLLSVSIVTEALTPEVQDALDTLRRLLVVAS